MSIVAAILFGPCVLMWLPLAANAVTIHRSDPAGRGLAVAYGAVNAGLLLLAMVYCSRCVLPGGTCRYGSR
jgi:hypothetical protein